MNLPPGLWSTKTRLPNCLPARPLTNAMALSIVVPVYNSEASLELLAGRIESVLGTVYSPLELILVNDSSRDRSWEVIERLQRQHRWIRGIQLARNFGQHNALLCGIRAAR